MGFVVRRTVHQLQDHLDQERYPGLEASAQACSVAEALELGAFLDFPMKVFVDAEQAARRDEFFALFAERLVGWNLQREDKKGTPVPCTLAGLRTLEPQLAYDLIRAWLKALVGVPGPLEQPSSDGDTSLEQSIPMETVSP